MTEDTTTRATAPGVAGRLVELLTQVYGAGPPVTMTAWDGSRVEAGPGGHGITVHVESRRTVRRLVWSPGQEGIAKAYIAGELTVDGDLETAVRLMRDYVAHAASKQTLEPADRREVLRLTVQLGAVGPALRSPSEPLDAVTGYLDVPAQIRTDLAPDLADMILGPQSPSDDAHREVVYTDPEPLSASVARWEGEQLRVDAVRETGTQERRRLGEIGSRLEQHLDAVVAAVGEQHARMWVLSLVLVRDNLERGLLRAYEITGTTALD